MQITSVKNIKTQQEVGNQYLHKDIDMTKSRFEYGKPLVVYYKTGSFFAHEDVVDFNKCNNVIKITTSKKIWRIE